MIGLHFVMADFDEIYEEQEENEDHSEESFVPTVPDPVVVRGAGNMTVWAYFIYVFQKSFLA